MASKKVLHIVRHAKSTWDYEGISDIDRPLKLRGIRDAYEMARRLKINHYMPQRLVCSPANRALHTAAIFMRVFESSYKNFCVDERMYGSGYNTILQVINEQDDELKELMIFGHNPTFSEVADYFASKDSMELPTCGIATFTFNCSKWSELSAGNLINELIDYPKKGLEEFG